MTVASSTKRHRTFNMSLIFQMEQWMALLIGIACLAVFLWAALDGNNAFPMWHSSHLGTTTLVSIGWFLTIVVGLAGVTLMRFAFYKRSEPESNANPLSGNAQTAPSGSTGNSNRSFAVAAGKRRR